MSLVSETEKRLECAYKERAEHIRLIEAGVMGLLDAKTRTELQIIAIYGSVGFPSISLDVTTDGHPPEMADAIERQVPSYNEFSGKAVASAIRALHEKGMIMRLAFGREGSPVLYIEPPYWTGQASNLDKLGKDWNKAHGESRSYTKTERDEMFRQIREILENTTKPDELGYCEDIRAGSYETDGPTDKTRYVRAWWD